MISRVFQGETFQSGSLADPVGSSPLLAAASWVQTTMLGTVASVVAILCVAALGMMMLSGRLNARRGAVVILGCFILFGAPVIANGLLAALSTERNGALMTPYEAPVASVAPLQAPPSIGSYDPYAGAAVPRSR